MTDGNSSGDGTEYSVAYRDKDEAEDEDEDDEQTNETAVYSGDDEGSDDE